MKLYITNCIAGYLCFNSDFELIDYILFKEEETVDKLIEIEKNKCYDLPVILTNI